MSKTTKEDSLRINKEVYKIYGLDESMLGDRGDIYRPTLRYAREMSRKIAREDDFRLAAHIEALCRQLEKLDKDLTKYALVRVSNPMQFKDNTIKVDMQYRLVHVDELESIPVYEDE